MATSRDQTASLLESLKNEMILARNQPVAATAGLGSPGYPRSVTLGATATLGSLGSPMGGVGSPRGSFLPRT